MEGVLPSFFPLVGNQYREGFPTYLKEDSPEALVNHIDFLDYRIKSIE